MTFTYEYSPAPPTNLPWVDQFSFLFYDFLTATFLGTLPLTSAKWSSTLNNAGSFSGTIDLSDPRIQLMNPAALTAPGRTMIFVDYNGTLVWGGLSIPARPFTRSTRQMSYTATELWGYFARRVQATDYSAPPYSGITGEDVTMPLWNAAYQPAGGPPSEWDPLLIGAQIINDALGFRDTAPILNGNPVGGMGLYLNGFSAADNGAAYLASGSGTPSGNYISIAYPFQSMQTVSTIVQQLAGLGYSVGFDFAIDVGWSNGTGSTPVAAINLSYPRRGRTFAQNNLVVQVAGSGRDYTVTPDASSMANTLYETGGSNDIVVSQNVNPLEQGYAVFESVVSRSQILSSSVSVLLGELGYGDLFLYSYPPATFSVVVPLFGADPQYGQFVVGDDARLLIDPDEMFNDGLDSEWRITSNAVNLPDEGDATMTLTMSPPPIYPVGAFV